MQANIEMEGSPSYQGWRVLGVVMLCAVICFGIMPYSSGVFIKVAAAEYGLSRADANLAIVAYFLGTGIWSPIVGRLFDNFSIRYSAAFGALLFGAGVAGIGLAHSALATFLLLMGPLSAGAAALSQILIGTALSRWFVRHRGKVIGIAFASTAIGGAAVPPLSAYLLETIGWRQALIWEGAGAGVILLITILLFMRDRPDGSAQPSQAPGAAAIAEDRTWSIPQLLVNRNFLLMTLALTLLAAFDQTLITNFIPYATDAGFSMGSATLVFTCLNLGALFGKLLCGALIDQFGWKRILFFVALGNIALAVTMIITPPLFALIAVFSVAGTAVGAIGLVWTIAISRLFGLRSYGLVAGTITFILNMASIVAVRLAGESVDRTGSYTTILIYFAIGCAIATVVVIAIGTTERSAARQSAKESIA